jgi:YHS domain-containing protein
VAKDFVCDTEVNEQETRFFSDYAGKNYYFCSPECKRKFDDHPDTFIQRQAREELRL